MRRGNEIAFLLPFAAGVIFTYNFCVYTIKLATQSSEGDVMPQLVKQSFHAWIDDMPGAKPKLIVTGELQVPTTGWKAETKRQVPQGINPKDLLLRVDAKAPSGPAGQIVMNLPLRYEEPASPGQFTQVTVLYEKESVTVDVKAVH
jgi:hypothetical protein